MLVNKVHANELDWLAVVGFGHDCLTLGCREASIRVVGGRRGAPLRAAEKGTDPGNFHKASTSGVRMPLNFRRSTNKMGKISQIRNRAVAPRAFFEPFYSN
jgi:hypothetical protein